MTTHSSILAWRIPWTKEPSGPQSMGSQSPTLLGDSHTHNPERALVLVFFFFFCNGALYQTKSYGDF